MDIFQDSLFGVPEVPKPVASKPAPRPVVAPEDRGHLSKPEWRIEARLPGSCGYIRYGYHAETEAELRDLWALDPCDSRYEIEKVERLT